MLRNQGIRTKLLAVLALPIVALIVVATIVSLQTFSEARKASEVEKLAQGADTLGQLVTAIQAERSSAAQLLQKKPVAIQVDQTRKNTDAALVRTRALIASVDIRNLSPEAVAAVAAATAGHEQLGNVRAQVDSGYAQPDRINERYSSMIANDLILSARIGSGLQNRAIGRQMSVYSSAQTLAELATQERELVLSMIEQREVNAQSATALARIIASEQQALTAFRLDGTKQQRSALDAAIYLPIKERAAYNTLRSQVAALANGDRVTIDPSAWRDAANNRLDALQKLLPSIANDVAVEAAAASSSASNTALLVLIGGLALVGLLLGLGLVLARAITRPLRHLTRVAGEVADELPRMVDRMATPGEGPGVTLPEIPFTAKDEVGQLATAFREVNDTTIRVAEEQAALRASIAEMFVNVARRNHVLLSRQLSFIDQLERTEENPDTLDNLFRLDHLATRMRRNAESLIVLAGIDAGRRLRRPMPLSDVIRTAVSEIERYDRVDLALQADPPMVGHVALTSAHLLAELLENATQFSNPDTRVVASTAFTTRGVRITITDLGLGMTWDEINEANQRIGSPPATEVVGSQRLGFYVVGRLARRLDATVELKPGRAQGTVVTIDLPPALFVSGTVAGPMGIVEPAEPTDADDSPTRDTVATADDRRPSTPSGLPSRGGAAAPIAPPAALPAPSPSVDGGLPRRSGGAAAPVAPADPAPVAEAPAAPRAGMFSSFRSRRAVESEVGASAQPEPASIEALAKDLPEFVPTLDTSTPALPHRSDVSGSSALIQADDPLGVADDATVGDELRDDESALATEVAATAATVEDVAPAEAYVPGLAEDDVAPAAWLPERQVSPLDDEWRPDAEEPDSPVPPAFSVVADLGLADEETDAQPAESAPALQAEPDVEPTVAESTVALEPIDELEPVDEPAAAALEPDVDAVHAGTQARSTLSELARETSQTPSPESSEAGSSDAESRETGSSDEGPDSSAQAPVPTVPAVAVTPIGAPAMDILPSRTGGRGRRLRRTARPKSMRPVAAPARPVEAPAPSRAHSTLPEPATYAPAGEPAPVVPAEPAATEAPAFGAPAPSAEPVAAPSSLFTPPPAAAEAEAPVEATPTPAFPPASVPALVAAQSLRERSAMASEALSELSALSTYRPEAMSASSQAASLVRRTPQSTPAAQVSEPQEPQGPRRANRNAADVRTMLSGFRAGVERGRTSPGGASGTTGNGSASRQEYGDES